MQERRDKSKIPSTPYLATPYDWANVLVKVPVISFAVSSATQPFQFLLNKLQYSSAGSPSAYSGSAFRHIYRGFFPYALAGQKRGAVAVTHKQTNRTTEEEEFEVQGRQRLLSTVIFSQFDLLVSNGLSGKSRLQNVDIITKDNFKWSFTNWWKLTTVNWGSRSTAGLVNFALIGFMGDYVSSFYKFDKDVYNKIMGGATSGVIATILTTIPNSYADRKLLASKVENGHLLTVTPFTMFNQMKSHVKTVGLKDAAMTFFKFNYLKEVAIRSPQSALTFAIIFGLDAWMGPEPLKRVWPADSEARSFSKKM